jgi:hypothetical protein
MDSGLSSHGPTISYCHMFSIKENNELDGSGMGTSSI